MCGAAAYPVGASAYTAGAAAYIVYLSSCAEAVTELGNIKFDNLYGLIPIQNSIVDKVSTWKLY